MTIEEAKQILLDRGMSTCSCKYGSQSELINKAKKIIEEHTKKSKIPSD